MKNEAIYQLVTDRIVAKMEQGVIPWQKPWTSTAPQNFISKKPYRGINLWLTIMNDFQSPYYLTFNQIKALKGTLKKGSKGTPIVFWNIKKKEQTDANGNAEVKTFPLLRYYTVFNAEQIEGIDFGSITQTQIDEVAKLDEIFEQMQNPVSIKHTNDSRAYYTPTFDYVNMPFKELFKGTTEYYQVLAHEVIHSTGHPNRLNRATLTAPNMDRESYSMEELVAELGACMLLSQAGIEPKMDNSASYIQGWAKVLKGDVSFIMKASKAAEQAVKYILKAQDEETEGEGSNEAEVSQAA